MGEDRMIMYISQKFSCLLVAFLVILAVFFFQVASANRQESSRYAIEYVTLGYQYDIIKDLVDSQVPFILDDEGVVRIEQSFRDVAEKLEKRIETRPSVIIKDPRHVSLLVLLFEQKGINYHVRLDNTSPATHVIWNHEDNKEAQQILTTSYLQAIKNSYSTGVLCTYNP
jgi:hypothetical protein